MAKQLTTLEELAEAVALVARYGNISAASKASGIPWTTLKRRYDQARNPAFMDKVAQQAAALSTSLPPSPEPLSNTEKLRFEDRIRSLEKKLKEQNAETLTAEKIGEFYFNLKDRPLVEPSWVIDPGHVGGIPGVPVTNWSDWHFSEVVLPEQVEGANAFNLEIFDRRFATLVNRTIDLCENHMTGKGYPGIVVNLGGDMLSGNIHEELAQTNEMEVIPATLALAGKIAWGLRQYADKFGRVFVVGVPGNHGRNTKKPQAKNACHTSFDWMIYKILESQFQDDDRFQFFIPNGFDAYYRVYGHRILLTHGDRTGARGGDGFIGAIGPIMRGTHKLRLSYAARGREIDTVLMGHWHNEIPMPGLRVNNCLKGYDEWAMSMRFTPTPPSQDLFFVHPKRGVTCSWPVQLESPAHGADENSWASWRKE